MCDGEDNRGNEREKEGRQEQESALAWIREKKRGIAGAGSRI
jgi:hypothetical protein